MPLPPSLRLSQALCVICVRKERVAQPRSGYTTTESRTSCARRDLSFRPIDVKLGPDGALYVADWSNPVINHGEVDFRDPRRDHHMGRIWRITKKDTPALKWEPLLGKKNEELLDKLLSKSAWEKEQARRVLIANDANNNELFQSIEKVPPIEWHNLVDIALSRGASIVGLRDSDDPRTRAAGSQMIGTMIPTIIPERLEGWALGNGFGISR